MTDLDLTRLWELHEKATPGPWQVAADNEILSIGQREVVSADLDDEFCVPYLLLSDCNADLIAETRNALPALLAALNAAQAEVERLTRQVDAVKALADDPDDVQEWPASTGAPSSEDAVVTVEVIDVTRLRAVLTDTEKGADRG